MPLVALLTGAAVVRFRSSRRIALAVTLFAATTEFGLRVWTASVSPAGLLTALIARPRDIILFGVGAPVMAMVLAAALLPFRPIRRMLCDYSRPI